MHHVLTGIYLTSVTTRVSLHAIVRPKLRQLQTQPSRQLHKFSACLIRLKAHRLKISRNQGTRVADKVLTANNGEIGYFVKKGTEFVPMTNFSVACTGYVVETPSSGCSEGFLFRVLPKTSLLNGEDRENDAETRYDMFVSNFDTQVTLESIRLTNLAITTSKKL